MTGIIFHIFAGLFTFICVLVGGFAHGQGISYRVNNGAGTGEFVQNANQKVYGRVDTIRFNFMTPFARFSQIGYQRNDSQPALTSGGMVWLNDSGFVKRTLLQDVRWSMSNTIGLTDSIHRLDSMAMGNSGNFANYYDKTTSDSRYYPLSSNPANYLTGITNAQVLSALGYTPYNSTNPNGYITSASIAGKADTATTYTRSVSDARFQPIGSYATTTQLNTKLAITDTANKWLSPGTAALLYYPLNSNPSNYLISVPAQSFASLTGKPTTLSGYGITDAYPLSGNPSSFLTAASITGKLNISDSAAMLLPYLRKSDATTLYQPVGSYATSSQLALKLNISDTGSMLNNYRNAINTNAAAIATKQNNISLTTTGSGAASLVGTTLNIPTITPGTGTVTSISTGLGLTGGTITTTGTLSVDTANGSILSRQRAVNTYQPIGSYLSGNTGTAGTYDRVTTDAQGRVTAGTSMVIDTLSASRTFNTAYQLSTTRYVTISPSAQISCNLSLSGGQAGTVSLQTSPDKITWTTVGQMTGSNVGTLTVGLNTTQVNGGQLYTVLQPAYWYQLLTTNTTGTPTFTMLVGGKTTY